MRTKNSTELSTSQTLCRSPNDPSEAGRIAGIQNLPPTSAVAPCPTEKRMLLDASNEAHRARGKVCISFKREEEERRDLKNCQSPNIFKEVLFGFKTKLKAAAVSLYPGIKDAARSVSYYGRAAAATLDRAPGIREKSANSYRFVYAALAGLLFIESCLNSYFFALGNKFGLLGGLFEALLIAGISIAISFAAGTAVRALYENGDWLRMAAICMAGAWASTLTVYHFCIGWLRAALVYGNPETAVIDALSNFARYKFSLPDLYCFGLALIGLIFCSSAFLAGYRSKDARRNANYARIFLDQKEAQKRLRAAKQNYLSTLAQLFDEALEDLDQLFENANDAARRLRMGLHDHNCRLESYKSSIHHIAERYNLSIAEFRRSNEIVRSTPSPKYFVEDPLPLIIEPLPFDHDPVAESKDILSNLEKRMEDLLSLVDSEKAAIRAEYEKMLESTPQTFAELCKQAEPTDIISRGKEGDRYDNPVVVQMASRKQGADEKLGSISKGGG